MSERYAGLTEEELQKMIQHAGVDQPVMSVRVVGDRVELCLLGGAVVPVPPFTPGTSSKPPTSDDTATMAQTPIGVSASDAEAKLSILESLTVRQLKSLAAEAGLQRYRRANKAALIVMLSEHYTLEELQTEVPF